MPDVFMLVHPVGTVLGRASYGDFFVAYQNCTVGANHHGQYPTFGQGVMLYAGASVIGASLVGDDVTVAAGALVIDSDLPSETVVVGTHPSNRILGAKASVYDRMFA